MSVELSVHGIAQAPGSGTPLVVLRAKATDRFLIIGIGPLELTAIAVALQDQPPPRPLTHDLLVQALAVCGARVTHALIHAVIEGVFHARLVLDIEGRHAELDSRASDAIAIALRVRIPVHAEQEVLDQAGVIVTAHGVQAPGDRLSAPGEKTERIGEEQLGAFRDALEGLNLDVLGRSDTER